MNKHHSFDSILSRDEQHGGWGVVLVIALNLAGFASIVAAMVFSNS